MHFTLRLSLFLVAGATPVGTAVAQRGPAIECAPCPPGAQCIRRSCPVRAVGAERVSSHVRARLDGRIIRYEIEERYANRGGGPAEVDYILPLPKGAAFENIELSINGEMVAGEAMRADRARGIYEEIVRKLRDPALVEWMGHDMLRARIFPIQPGEEKRMVVRFSAVAEREGDAIRVDWAARAMPDARYDDDWFELRYPCNIAGGHLGDAYSPTHSLTPLGVSEARQSGTSIGTRPAPSVPCGDRSVTPAAGNDVPGEAVVRAENAGRAMTILVPLRRDAAAALSMLTYAPGDEDGYALITLSPPVRGARNTARDLTFVLDVSGSMSGQKMTQARAAGRQFLASLDRGDRFRIIAFAGDVREFREGWSAGDAPSIREAGEFLDGLRPGGGTNISGALDAALGTASPADRVPLVLLITDGAPTIGETQPDRIARAAADHRGRARVFTFGLGSDVNARLIERLALEGRGTATFLRPDESVERAVGIVAQRLTRPVASDVTIRLDGARLYAVQPQGPIDVFGGQDLVVLARYAGSPGAATLTVEGRGSDDPVRWTQRVQLARRGAENDFIARLWAVQRVGWLSAERRRGGPSQEIDDELRSLGERHGIPTELTSYLVVEPGMQTILTDQNPARGPFAPARGAAAAPANGSRAGLAPGGAGGNAPATVDVQRFEAARLSSEQRAVTTLGGERKHAPGEAEAEFKLAGSRSFRLDRSGRWSDTRPATAARTLRVQAYSDAYFAMVRVLPELSAWLTVGDNVRIEGRAVAIEVTTLESGLTTLDAAQLAGLVRDWR
ncbi:MAG: VWA domain-containing protein [Gemmatimonadaceae bacterium]|nr:VWA domain-containing protein [Gemmatimonadaceae bacterium]